MKTYKNLKVGRNVSLFAWCFIMLVGNVSSLNAQDDSAIGVKKIVIDPGHGGQDPGAVGFSGVYEKDIALDVSLRLGKLIKANYPDVEVIFTRETDKFVSLYDRAKLANQEKADLFISIHANAATNRSAYGSETWVLGLHKSAAALEVAKRENASILMEEDHETKYEDFNPNNPDDYIGLSLRQSVHLDQSLNLAAKTQHEFKHTVKRYDRGVKQAGFLVLYKTTMPAILIELGFVSNQKEEIYLASEKGKTEMSHSIFEAFSAYKKSMEDVNSSVQGNGEKTANNVTIPPTNKEDSKEETSTPKEVESSNNSKENSTVDKSHEKSYKVQFQMSSKKIDLEPSNFKGLNDLFVYESNGYFKYTSGEFDTFEQANEHKNKVRSTGYSTAFVVTFQNGKRIK
jgi:N-acetylmuramoyl-L-alanine amidase